MSTRRSFFSKLLAAAAAPFIPIPKAAASTVLSYRGREMFGEGVVFCPYIPIHTTKTLSDFTVSKSLMESMSTQIQDKIDGDLINRVKIYHDNHHH